MEYQKWNTANSNFYHISKEIQKELKLNQTPSEKIFWENVRRKKLGYRIRRQHIIDVFIVDFVCIKKKLVIEIDGKIHQYQKDYDQARTNRLNEMEFEVIRFTNEQIINDLENVLSKVKSKLDSI